MFTAIENWELTGLSMNNAQFKLAVKGLKMQPKNIEIARRILVDKESRQQLMDEIGIGKQQLSKILNKILDNFQVQLNKRDLVFKECVVSKSMEPIIDILEAENLKGIK